jgi:glucosamine-6-phosphate deaminase
MEVIVRPDAAAACRLVARLVARQLREQPDSVLGLATGRTMEKVYGLLAAMHRDDGLDFSLTRTFNLDEYIGLPADHPGSYRSYMNAQLFNRINIDPRNTFLPSGMADDLKREAVGYEAAIRRAGGIDLQLLGIGATGHIGFNEPLSALSSRTRDKSLTPETIAQNGPLFDRPEDMPRRAMTMGIGTILEARRIVLLATGSAKADILARAVEGPITAMISASALQLHPACVVVVDEPAAARLQGRDYYQWIFDNEPDWADFR